MSRLLALCLILSSAVVSAAPLELALPGLREGHAWYREWAAPGTCVLRAQGLDQMPMQYPPPAATGIYFVQCGQVAPMTWYCAPWSASASDILGWDWAPAPWCEPPMVPGP